MTEGILTKEESMGLAYKDLETHPAHLDLMEAVERFIQGEKQKVFEEGMKAEQVEELRHRVAGQMDLQGFIIATIHNSKTVVKGSKK